MSTLGLLQYLGPSIQFVLGLWLFKEPFSSTRAVGFGLIWMALVIYSFEAWRFAQTNNSKASNDRES
jgi:chloramphenicol-sensitive protein RarD